jgi:uncharacterized repeat protein (TIGR01451 family)
VFLNVRRATMKPAIPIAIGALLFLLCACAKQGPAPPRFSDIPPLTSPTALNQTASPIPTRTAPPSPATTTARPTADRSEDAAQEEHSVKTTADLGIRSEAPRDAPADGTTVYTLTVYNQGPALATGIVLTDVLPAGVIPLRAQSARPVCQRQGTGVDCTLGDLRGGDTAAISLDLSVGGTETPITGTHLAGMALDLSTPICVSGRDDAQSYFTCHLAELQPYTTAQVGFTVNLDNATKGSFLHTATVTAVERDTDLANNRVVIKSTVDVPVALAVTAVPTAADLVLEADGPQSVVAGRPFTYTLTVTNRGALDATLVRLQDVLPPATDLTAYRPASPACEQIDDTLTCHLRNPDSGAPLTFTLVITGHAGQPLNLELDPLAPGWPICGVIRERSYLDLLNCSLGTLKPGAAARVEFVLIARGIQERTMVNTAVVNSGAPEVNALDNTITTTISVQTEADLALRPLIRGPVIAARHLSYTLTVENKGPSDAGAVILNDTLTSGTKVVSASASQGEGCRIDRSVHAVSCKLDRLDGGETATVTIEIAADRSVAAITHSASVQAKPVDPDPTNNQLTESIPIDAEPGPADGTMTGD